MIQSREVLSEKARIALADFIAASSETISSRSTEYSPRSTSGTKSETPLLCVQRLQGNFLRRFKDTRRPLLVFGSNNTRLFNALMASHSEACAFKSVDLEEVNVTFVETVDKFSPDSIVGFSGFIAYCTPFISEKSRTAISTLLLTGEWLSPAQKAYFTEQYPRARVHMQYAAAECGLIGDQCAYLPPNRYHPAEGVAVEFNDIDTPHPKILITIPGGALSPSRYDIGDYGEPVSDLCPCGNATTFEHFGRDEHGSISLCGARINISAFETALSAALLPSVSARLKLEEVQQGNKLKGHITLLVHQPYLETAKRNAHTFSSALQLTPTKHLSRMVDEDIFLPLSVEPDAPLYNKSRIFRA